MASTTILRALVSFTFEGSAGPVFVTKGKTYHKDAVQLQGLSVEALENNFAPFEPDFSKAADSEIEQATAAPGEKRNTRIRKESKSETAESTEEKTEEPAEQTAGNADTTDYSELKQPELKALLNQRGIEYPSGVVSNADLIALLESKSETA